MTAGGPGQNVRSAAGGITSLSIRTLKQLPTLLGEVDVLRTAQFLPGVSNVGEASSGFNVRSGGADQNLILLDDAPLFNVSHLPGFISVFNSDVAQDVNFYRGVAPTNLGGRAASVLQTRLKEARATTFGRAGGVVLTGWISYTFSQTRFLVDGPFAEATVNKGAYYPAAYDKPHILNVVLNYKLSPRVSVSANGVYTSGRPITYPYAKVYVGNRVVPYFTERNQDRLPDYLRFDMGLTISGVQASQRPGSKRRVETDVNLSLYNRLGRRNACSVFVQTPSTSAQYYNGANAYKLSVLGAIIPSISYNVRF